MDGDLCPGGCGRVLTGGRFICNFCSEAAPDHLVIQMAEAHDQGDAAAVAAAGEQIRDELTGD